MKTPDEIKKEAETCMNHPHTYSCNSCRLYGECHGIAEHIIKELYDLVVHYESHIAQVERERDAAVKVMRMVRLCENCKHIDKPCESYPCSSCSMDRERRKPNWEWRGVCAENTKDGKQDEKV